jgi:hypothetical protein
MFGKILFPGITVVNNSGYRVIPSPVIYLEGLCGYVPRDFMFGKILFPGITVVNNSGYSVIPSPV